MVHLFTSLIVFGLVSLVAASPQYEEINRNADCDNDCFFGSFPGGSCTNDDACMCTQQKYRERYFCCMAEKCAASVLPDSIERQTVECEARNMEFTFDVEKVCGIKLTTASTASAAAASTTTTTTTTPSEGTSTTTGEFNESSATSASTAAASTPDSATEASSAGGSESSSTSSSEATSTETTAPVENSASQARVMLNGVLILDAIYGVWVW